MIHNLDNYNVYICSDNRVRAYDKVSKSVISFPRIILENKINRKLKPYEDVHHIDENPLNNDKNNLDVKLHGIHQSFHATKYKDIIMVCPVCQKEFVWTAKQQRYFYSNKSRKDGKRKTARGPFCSKRCIGLSGRKNMG